MGQISLNLNPDGATFQDSDLAKLPEPLENEWKIGRLNPSFGQSEIQKQAFKVSCVPTEEVRRDYRSK